MGIIVPQYSTCIIVFIPPLYNPYTGVFCFYYFPSLKVALLIKRESTTITPTLFL